MGKQTRRNSDSGVIKWQLKLLELIPHGHKARGATVSELKDRLERYCDKKINERTLQRTLRALANDPEWSGKLVCHVRNEFGKLEEVDFDEGSNSRRTQYWKWIENDQLLLIPGIGRDEALALLLIQERLESELPPATRDCLLPYFKKARQSIENLGPGNLYNKWLKKIAYVSPTQPRLPAKVNRAVHDAVLGALHEEMQIEIAYRSRVSGKMAKHVANPLALLMRGPVTYLLATLNRHTTPAMLALHRIRSARQLDSRADTPSGFKLDQYLESGGGEFGTGKLINLEALFDSATGEHLLDTETPLTASQQLTKIDGGYQLSARLPDTLQLRWWLLAFGPRVEVIGPTELREWVAAEHASAANLYRKKEHRHKMS